MLNTTPTLRSQGIVLLPDLQCGTFPHSALSLVILELLRWSAGLCGVGTGTHRTQRWAAVRKVQPPPAAAQHCVCQSQADAEPHHLLSLAVPSTALGFAQNKKLNTLEMLSGILLC